MARDKRGDVASRSRVLDDIELPRYGRRLLPLGETEGQQWRAGDGLQLQCSAN